MKSLGGLSTAQTARAFLVPEPTMAARLLRARRKIAHARIPFRVPSDDLLDERMRGVLAVVYLVFTEGHTASDGDALTRPDLCAEAIRLGRLLCELMPDDAEAHGLLALMLFTDARRAARTGPDGEPIDLRDQDRRLWDRDAIAEATGLLERSLRLREPGPYALQAGIALCHDRARSFAATDWGWIASLYGELQRLQPTPVVAVNRAVAVSFARTPEAGLELLDELRDERGAARLRAAARGPRGPAAPRRRPGGRRRGVRGGDRRERERGPARGPGGPAGSGGGGGCVVSSAPPRARVEFCSVCEQ